VAGPRPQRHDSYGRPLPSLAEAARQADTSERVSNVEQRERLLELLRTTMDEHYPYLLRRNVTAEVTIRFKVVQGVIQDDLYLSITRKYREGED
jgi:hypothetical protein